VVGETARREICRGCIFIRDLEEGGHGLCQMASQPDHEDMKGSVRNWASVGVWRTTSISKIMKQYHPICLEVEMQFAGRYPSQVSSLLAPCSILRRQVWENAGVGVHKLSLARGAEAR
jgi:hypothetical protein